MSSAPAYCAGAGRVPLMAVSKRNPHATCVYSRVATTVLRARCRPSVRVWLVSTNRCPIRKRRAAVGVVIPSSISAVDALPSVTAVAAHRISATAKVAPPCVAPRSHGSVRLSAVALIRTLRSPPHIAKPNAAAKPTSGGAASPAHGLAMRATPISENSARA